MRADGRIDAAGAPKFVSQLVARRAVGRVRAHHLGIERLAHAMQPLELVGALPCRGMHGGNGVGVVGGKLREERGRIGQQQAHARQIRHIRVHLARKHGIVGEPALLRPLDLAVPIGALDEPHGDAPARRLGQPVQPAQDRHGALAVGLHGKAQRGPALERGIAEGGHEQAKREIEAVLLLGIDGEADPLLARRHGQRDDARQQLGGKLRLLARIEAGVDGRELHRDAGPRHQRVAVSRRRSRRRTDRRDRRAIAVEIARSVGGRLGPLAQHVEGEAVALRLVGLGAVERFLDRAPQHEVVAEDAHGLAQRLADDGLAGAGDEPLQRCGGPGALVLAQPDDAPRQHQAEGRSIDEPAVGGAQVLLPAPLADLLGDQRIGGVRIGDAQQSLRQAHQDDALLGGEPVLVHEGVHAAVAMAIGARRRGQPSGQSSDLPSLAGRRCRGLAEARDEAFLIGQKCGSDLVARRPVGADGTPFTGHSRLSVAAGGSRSHILD